MSNDHGLTLRELVLEIRDDVKTLDGKIDQIDKQGSIGTRDELQDHEGRIRSLEVWRYGIPASILIALASSIAIALRIIGV